MPKYMSQLMTLKPTLDLESLPSVNNTNENGQRSPQLDTIN
jgi:hypothetical protein